MSDFNDFMSNSIDSMSDSDDSSHSDITICEEMNDLIAQWENIHLHHHEVIDTLESLYSLIIKQDNVVIVMEGHEYKWETFIEELHSRILEDIKQGKEVSFGRTLLEVFDKCTMKY